MAAVIAMRGTQFIAGVGIIRVHYPKRIIRSIFIAQVKRTVYSILIALADNIEAPANRCLLGLAGG